MTSCRVRGKQRAIDREGCSQMVALVKYVTPLRTMRAAAVLLVFGVLLLALIQDAGADTGVLNPTSYYQRYRRAEYSADKPFYQVSNIRQ